VSLVVRDIGDVHVVAAKRRGRVRRVRDHAGERDRLGRDDL
jgi:hypothetical protein